MSDTEARGGARAKILVVDDDHHTRDILARWLARESYEPTSASDGAEALAALEEAGEFDVIVLDVMMPGMDGLQVCQRLREHETWRSIPVILLTAKDDIETRARGMTLGVSEYLTKPVTRQALMERIQAQLNSRTLARQLSRTAAAIEKAGPQ